MSQFGKLWSELTLQQRSMLGISAAVLMAGVAGILLWASRPRMHVLYSRLDSAGIAEVSAVLEEEGIPFSLSDGGTGIYVPAERVDSARIKLAAQGLPKKGGVGYEIFDDQGFGVSNFMQRTNFLRAIQGELARTISELQSVRSARVIVALPENRLLVNNPEARPTASVFVDTLGSDLTAGNVRAIRFLVANSVEGLMPEDVALVDQNGRAYEAAPDEDDLLGGAMGQLQYISEIERYYTEKVQGMLQRVLGSGNAVVRVSAAIESDAQITVEERYDPDGRVLRSSTETEDTTENSESAPGGDNIVGVDANIPGGGGLNESSVVSTNREISRQKTNEYEINRTTVERTSAPGKITSLTASVFLAQPFVTNEETGEVEVQPRSDQEMERIRKLVAGALGIQGESSEIEKLVTIAEMPISDALAKPDASNRLFQMENMVVYWIELLQPVFSILAAGIIFIIILKKIRKHKAEIQNLEIVGDNPRYADAGPANNPVTLTPETLNALIEEKPENISAALKTWALGNNQEGN